MLLRLEKCIVALGELSGRVVLVIVIHEVVVVLVLQQKLRLNLTDLTLISIPVWLREIDDAPILISHTSSNIASTINAIFSCCASTIFEIEEFWVVRLRTVSRSKPVHMLISRRHLADLTSRDYVVDVLTVIKSFEWSCLRALYELLYRHVVLWIVYVGNRHIYNRVFFYTTAVSSVNNLTS